MDKFIISVLELNTYVGDNLYSDPFLEELWIKGEIADVNINRNTAYFVLTDAYSSVNCVMFNYSESGIDLPEFEGSEIILSGKITLFKKNGSFKVIADKVDRLGEGSLYQDFKILKEKLEREGIFSVEHKKPIPPYPRRIGIVTSKDGAAIHDLTHIIFRRNPFIKITLYPVKVQGDNAVFEIVNGIEYLNANIKPDIIIIGRGGGSAEDLNAFNSEKVVRAVFDSNIPVISAVGHENDFTLTDLAADLRASTPSAAAELAVPLADDILNKIDILSQALRTVFYNKINNVKERLYELNNKLNISNPQKCVTTLYEKVYNAKYKLNRLISDKYKALDLQYTSLREKITLLNPDKVYSTEYVKVLKRGREVTETSKLKPEDTINIVFRDGMVEAEVKSITVNG